uniref:Uncharacterized protein n=1 Tax=Avena sativa TaxID=4498 RepID=A0ACD5TDP5_AVESA
MDPKAAARSKRSHTVHGRRTHQTPAAAAAHKQKRAAAAGGSSSSAPRSRNLPSNWDRYESEPEADDPTEWTGEVAPRSKGADFTFLLEQARAQPREERGLGGRLASQDSPFDFMQASTSMLEAKGEGIMSWFEDDNFILDDDLAPAFEVPFLSMDLHALATQLSKIKLSQRLFIEKDLLPEDMDIASESEESEILIQCDTTSETDAKDSSVQHDFKDVKPGRDEETTTSPEISARLVHSGTEGDKSYTGITDTVPSTGHRTQSKLELAAPEEELDMLLNTLDGTHLSSSNLDNSFGSNETLEGMKINESNEKAASSTSSKSLALAPLDDDLDALLSETSLPVQNEGFAASSLTSQPTFDSDSNNDFRHAKQIDVTSIDDSVDDLLADTSFFLNDQNQTMPVQGQQNISGVNAPPHSGSSNVSDDFDSWFDSLQK